MKQTIFLAMMVLTGMLLPAQRPDVTMKFYGFVRNDFFYNSRANEEAIDGTLHLIPRPVVRNNAGVDINAAPQAEMISINTRIGIDFTGSPILGAKSSAKIEFDFAGTGTTFFLAQIRHAYMQLNWEKSSLLVGQTWHPLFGSVVPSGVSFNSGAPFQPFNRSPQVRLTHQLFKNITLMGVASYQMQHNSNGPLGFTSAYMKNALRPNVYAGAELKKQNLLVGAGIDLKKIKPDTLSVRSLAAVGYAQYVKPGLQIKMKSVIGQNLSDHFMMGGYGYGASLSSDETTYHYYNLGNWSSFLNVLYGKKWQVGIFAGYLENLGIFASVLEPINGKYRVYGRGFYNDSQQIINNMYRFAPMVIYNLPNLNIGLEYNYSSAEYGTIGANGIGSNPYRIGNHRVVVAINYLF